MRPENKPVPPRRMSLRLCVMSQLKPMRGEMWKSAFGMSAVLSPVNELFGCAPATASKSELRLSWSKRMKGISKRRPAVSLKYLLNSMSSCA